MKLVGADWAGSTFASKTTTFAARAGKMPLKEDRFTPKERFPKCIHVSPLSFARGAALNAVSLSGPGLPFLIQNAGWQDRTDTFWISIMTLAPSREERIEEIRSIVAYLLQHKSRFKGKFGIQLNVSCPNGGLNPKDLIAEVMPMLDILRALGVPVVVKFGIDLSIEAAMEIEKHEVLDGIVIFNTIPWPKLHPAEQVYYFGTTVSPLIAHLGEKFPGGASGAMILERLLKFIPELRKAGFKKHINGGGGILCPHDGLQVLMAGADSISLGSIAMLRPWNLSPTIRFMRKIHAGK
ncbi:MAG: hypothetical protein V4526_02375 [Patescibacteria group bacterium]